MDHLPGSAGALYIDAMFVAMSYLKQSSVQSTSKCRKGRKKMLMCLDYIKVLRLTKSKGEKSLLMGRAQWRGIIILLLMHIKHLLLKRDGSFTSY